MCEDPTSYIRRTNFQSDSTCGLRELATVGKTHLNPLADSRETVDPDTHGV